MIFSPPQHGKSEIVSRRCPAWMLGRDPDIRLIGGSYAASLASDFNRDVQQIIDGQEFRRLFPGSMLAAPGIGHGRYLRKSDEFEMVGYRGGLRSIGRSQGVSGRSADFVMIDDPYSGDEEARSPAIRRAVSSWYRTELFPRLAANGCLCITMTRWHRQDLCGELLALADSDPQHEKWTVLSFPAIAGDSQPDYDPRASGEPLAPSRYSLDELEKRRRMIGPYNWQAMFQQRPGAEGGSEWPDDYFGDAIWFDEWPEQCQYKAVALDPSKGKNAKTSDYSAFVMLAVSMDGTLYLDADLDRRNTKLIVETAMEINRTFKPDALGIETNQFQELLADEIVRTSMERGVMLPVFEILNQVAKEVRIRRLTPYLGRGVVRFKRGSRGARLLVEQLKDFPNGDHDDGPDAAEMAIRLAAEQLEIRYAEALGDNRFRWSTDESIGDSCLIPISFVVARPSNCANSRAVFSFSSNGLNAR